MNIVWTNGEKTGIKISHGDSIESIELNKGDKFNVRGSSSNNTYVVTDFGWGTGFKNLPRSIYFYAEQDPAQTKQSLLFDNNDDVIKSIYNKIKCELKIKLYSMYFNIY